MRKFLFNKVTYLILVTVLGASAFCQTSSGPSGDFIRPPAPPPRSTPTPTPVPTPTPTPTPTPISGTPIGASINQRGLGSRTAMATRAGGAANIIGSRSYTYSVPLFSLPGRHGLNLNLALFYNSLMWENVLGAGVTFNSETASPSAGFRLDYGYIDWNTSENVSTAVLVDATGAKHPLVAATQFGSQFNTTDSTYISVQHHFGTGSTDLDSDIVTYKDGKQAFYQEAPGSLVTCCSGGIVSGSHMITRPVKIEDSTGNFITINYEDTASTNLSSVVDTVGRTISFVYSNGLLTCVTDATTCNAAGSRTFNFAWNTNYILNYQFSSYVVEWPALLPPFQGSSIPYTVLIGITRPDGTQVQFTYGDWMIVNDIREVSNNGSLRYEANYNFPLASAGPLTDPPTYTQEIVTTFDKDGNTKQATWLYQSTLTNPQPAERLVSCFAVTDPMGTSHITTISASGNVFDGLPIKEVTATGSSTPCTNAPTTILRTVTTQWTTDVDSTGALTGANPRAQTTTTILADGTTQAQSQSAYDGHGNRTDVKQFDFGSGKPGPLLKETVTAFASNLGSIFDHPSDIQIKDAAGNVLRHETFGYDDYTTTALATVPSTPPGFDTSPAFLPGSATPRGNLTSSTVYSNAAAGTGAITTNFSYDVLGNLLAISGGCCTSASAAYSSTTQYAYPDSVSEGPAGAQLTTHFTYDLSNGRAASVTDPNGQITRLSFDVDNRLSSTVTPDTISATYTYDDSSANPSVLASNSADSLVSRVVKDFSGHMLIRQIRAGTSVVSTTAYINDLLGRPIQASNPFAPAETALYTTYNLDGLNRRTATTPPSLSGAVQKSYQTVYGSTSFTDAAGVSHFGATVQTTDPAGHSRLQYTNALGFVMRVDELNPVPSTSAYSTFYSYDAIGNLVQILQGQQTRTYSYDSMGRRLSECLPETANQCTTYAYTDFNAIKTRTDPRGIVITYGFDSQNRVNDVQYSDGTPEAKFVYGASGAANNGGGRLISSTDGTGSKTYQYDVMGRLTQISQIIGVNTYTTKYSYAGGRIKTITYPSGANGAGTQVTYAYDNIGRLSSVLLGANTIYTAGSYNAAGQVLTNTFGNGVSGAFSYNNRLQLGSLRYANASAALLDLAYNYGGATDNGEIIGITDNADSTHSTSYVYDGIGRLQQAQTVDQLSLLSWNLQFAYDRYGNRLSQTPVGGQMAMPSSQLAFDPATNHVIATGVSYDAAGNMISDSAFNYAFDANNAVTAVFMPGVITPSANYSYDSAGNRVIRNGNYYIYLGGHVIAEYANAAGAASPTTEYIYVGSRRVATLSNGTITYHYWDHLSVRTSADASGNSVRGYGSFPFGETWYETGTAQKWKFTTYENDSESGLNYANARFHSPRLGRFMSLDPLAGNLRNPQSFNRYAYVRNNPISSTDSTGMFCDMDCDDDGGGGGGGGEGGTPCGPFECSGDPGPDPTPEPDPNDLPDAPEPKPDVLQNNNASADLDFVFNGASQTLQPSNDLTDLSALSLPTTTGSIQLTGNLGGDDVLVGMDLWHNTDQCQGCGTMWRQASNTGNMIFAGTGIVLGGVPLAAEGALVAVNLSAQAIGWYSGLTGGAGVVLGKFPEYIEAAEEMGANVFNLSSGLYNVLDRMGASWTANQAFLDASIYRGQQFYLSSVASSGSYWMELQYLSSRGYGPDTWEGAFIRF